MPLFNTIADVNKYAGGVNSSLTFESLKPSLNSTERNMLLPELGEEMYNVVLDAYEASIAPSPTALPAEIELLLGYARAVVVPFALLHFKELAIVQINETGAKEKTPQNADPVRMWVNNLQTERLLAEGYTAIDNMLAFMEANKTFYPEWVSSTAYTRFTEFLLSSTEEFNGEVEIGKSRRMFKAMRADIKFVEDTVIKPNISEALYTRLRTAKTAGTLTTEENAALQLCLSVIANMALAESSLPVMLGSDNIYYIEHEAQFSSTKKTVPDRSAITMVKSAAQKRGSIYLDKLVIYLNDTATNSVLSEYYNSDIYATRADDTTDPDTINDTLTKTYAL